MYGRAEIAAAADPGSTITLPTEAVLIKGRESVVYVEAGHLTFQRRTVTVSAPIDGHVTVLSGLSPGDHVVVKGALLLDGVADQLL
jgi:cobalt-zinc-cadmium efflux system membrane fusion protein